jgi:hypothetical protein
MNLTEVETEVGSVALQCQKWKVQNATFPFRGTKSVCVTPSNAIPCPFHVQPFERSGTPFRTKVATRIFVSTLRGPHAETAGRVASSEDRICTGPPRARTEVVCVVLKYWAISRRARPDTVLTLPDYFPVLGGSPSW